LRIIYKILIFAKDIREMRNGSGFEKKLSSKEAQNFTVLT